MSDPNAASDTTSGCASEEPQARVTPEDEFDRSGSERPGGRGFWPVVALCVAIGLAIRVASVLAWYRHLPLLFDDNYFYHEQARLLARGRGFTNPFFLRQQHVVAPSAAHPPLFTTYLALWSLIGFGGVTDHRIVACLLGATLAVPMALIGRRIGGRVAGMVAALFAAVFPPLWINDGLLLSETAAVVAVAWVMVAALAAYDRPSSRRFALLGASIGVAALARSELIALAAILAVPIAVLSAMSVRRRSDADDSDLHAVPEDDSELSSRRSILRRSAIALACTVAVIAPWVIRNATQFERPTALSTGAGFVLEIANCDATYSGEMTGYWSPQCARTTPPSTTDESIIEAALRTTGVDYIASHKKQAVRVAAIRVLRTFHLFNPAQGASFDQFFERRPKPAVLAGLWLFYPTLLLAGIGIVSVGRPRRKLAVGDDDVATSGDTRWYANLAPAVVLLAPILTAVFAAASGIGITRYRAVGDVAIAIAASVSIARLGPITVGAIRWIRDVATPWLHRHFTATVIGIAGIGLAVRSFVVLVSWPTCPIGLPPKPGSPPETCFRLWGDAFYSSFQGVLNGRGHLYKNGITWYLRHIYQNSAGDPPFFSGFLGIVAWYGGDRIPDWLRLTITAAVLALVMFVVKRFVSLPAAVAAVMSSGVAMAVVVGMGGESASTQRLVGSTFGAIGIVFIGLCAKELAGPVAGLVAATIAVVHPLIWINDTMLMSESPYVAFLAFALWAALRYRKSRTLGWAAWMALGLAFAAATRAEASTLFVLLVLPLILRTKAIAWKSRFIHLAVCAAIAISVISPWLVWNSMRFRAGSIVTMTTGTGSVLGSASCDDTYYGEKIGYWSNCISEPFTATASGSASADSLVADALHTSTYNARVFAMCGVTIDDQVITDPTTTVPNGKAVTVFLPRQPVAASKCPSGVNSLELDESESDGLVQGIALDYIEEHSDRLPALAVLRVLRMASLYKPMQTWQIDYQIEGRGYWSSLIGMWMWWAMAVPAAGGLIWLTLRRKPVLEWVAVLACIAITAAGTFGVNRYRVPADVVEIILFAVAAAALLNWLGAKVAKRDGTSVTDTTVKAADDALPSLVEPKQSGEV